MNDKIILRGVTTHNLKNINVQIPINKTTVIYGRSGAGKSSLAFSSLYQICHDEFEALENGYFENNEYIIEGYEGLIPAIAISQKNTNNNPRSTIYSYLNIPQILSSIKRNNQESIPDFHFLKLNKINNKCNYCLGLGEVFELAEENIINYESSIIQKPFLCWNNSDLSDYYNKQLIAYCEYEHIDITTPFKNLSEKDKNKILYGKSLEKIQFRYKIRGKYRSRTSFYQGVLLYIKQNNNLRLMEKYGKKFKCPSCDGSRINSDKYKCIQIFGIPMQQFLLMPIDELTLELNKKSKNISILTKTLDSICEMGLGYLNLSRSIPTLSGGELQKLKFSKLLNSTISGVLIIIDEISSQINANDFHKIWNKIKKISQFNTLVLVEHSQFFIDKADYRIHIGRDAGQQGGNICSDEKIHHFYNISKKNNPNGFIKFEKLSKNNVIQQSVEIPKKCITVFTGPTGSGKSSLAKAISEKSDAIYITQKNGSYSSRSILSSTIKINDLVAEYFAGKTKTNCDIFSPTRAGACKNCQGTGVIKYERGFERDIYLTCPVCEGNLFDINNELILKQQIGGKNIIEIYSMELGQAISFFEDEKIKEILYTLISLGLSHIQLKRKTQTLSEGELRRIKISEHLARKRVSKKILIIDEPVAGLDPETASKVASFIYSKSKMFEAIILIEHREELIRYADYEVILGTGSGLNGGKVLKQFFKT